MSFELCYTSVPKGLRAGTRGFCTVAFTEGMPSNYVELAESLSGYRNVFQPQDANYALNPPAFSHYQFIIGGERTSVLSRVCSCAVDYTGRTNKFAHHLFVRRAEMAEAGPACIMNQPGLFQTEWKEEPHLIKTVKRLPVGQSAGFRAAAWEQLGDAGWAGALAQAATEEPARTAYIIFKPGANLLPLLAEALNLVAPDRRWSVTFNTYFTSLPQGTSCQWRCCLPDSEALKELRRSRDALAIDLTQPLGKTLITGPLVECARSGTTPVWPKRSAEIVWGSSPAAGRTEVASDPAQTQAAGARVSRLTVRPEERAAAGAVPRLRISSHAKPAEARKLGPIIAITAGVTAAIVMVLAGGVFVLTRSGKTTPIEQQPVTPRAEPVPEPPRIQVKELPPEKVAEPVAQEPPDSRPPAVTPLPERPPESVPEQPPQPATIPPELRVSMALLRANGKDRWTESVNLGADWENLTYDFYDARGTRLDVQRKNRRNKVTLEGIWFEKAPKHLAEACATNVTFYCDDGGKTELSWLLVEAGAVPRYLLVVQTMEPGVTFEDTRAGYNTLLRLPASAACFLSSNSLTAQVSFPYGHSCAAAFEATPTRDGIQFVFSMPAGDKKACQQKTIDSEKAASQKQSDRDNSQRTKKDELTELRAQFAKDEDDVKDTFTEHLPCKDIRLQTLSSLVLTYRDACAKHPDSPDRETVEKALRELANAIVVRFELFASKKTQQFNSAKSKVREKENQIDAASDKAKQQRNPKEKTAANNEKRALEDDLPRLKHQLDVLSDVCAQISDSLKKKRERCEADPQAFLLQDALRKPIKENDLSVRMDDLKSLLGLSRDNKTREWSSDPNCAVAKLLSLPVPRGPPAAGVARRPEDVLPEAVLILDRHSPACILKLRQETAP